MDVVLMREKNKKELKGGVSVVKNRWGLIEK
jgi:hypothetical protein